MHTSVTLTRSKVNVKVAELVKFQKLHFSVYLVRCFGMELKTDGC